MELEEEAKFIIHERHNGRTVEKTLNLEKELKKYIPDILEESGKLTGLEAEPYRAKATEENDKARLEEIKRQIEEEVEQAVERKLDITERFSKQKIKYHRLLEELDNTFKSGGISEENYIHLKEKYLKRMDKSSGAKE